MGSCSSPELEPGPLPILEETAIVGPPEPPVFTPLAQEFASHNGAWLGTLDASIAILDAESAIDLGGDLLGSIGALANVKSAAVDPEALANLQAAEDGYRVARTQTASLQANLSPDVQQPTRIGPLNFFVVDAAGVPIAGVLVTIDADFGNGSTRSTDGGGFCNFGVALDVTVAWAATRAGYASASGTARVFIVWNQRVTLQAA